MESTGNVSLNLVMLAFNLRVCVGMFQSAVIAIEVIKLWFLETFSHEDIALEPIRSDFEDLVLHMAACGDSELLVGRYMSFHSSDTSDVLTT